MSKEMRNLINLMESSDLTDDDLIVMNKAVGLPAFQVDKQIMKEYLWSGNPISDSYNTIGVYATYKQAEDVVESIIDQYPDSKWQSVTYTDNEVLKHWMGKKDLDSDFDENNGLVVSEIIFLMIKEQY